MNDYESEAERATAAINDMDSALIHAVTLSEEAHNEQLKLYDLEADKRRSTEFLSEREAVIYAQVCAETKEGKPVFGNDGARKAETAVRLKGDAAYRATQTELQTKGKDIAMLKTRIELLNTHVSLFKAYMHGGGNGN